MTLGQLRNAIDAMLQRGEFNPNLPASVLLPELFHPHEANKPEKPNEQS